MNGDGTGLRTLARGATATPSGPAWSRNGKEVLFARNVEGGKRTELDAIALGDPRLRPIFRMAGGYGIADYLYAEPKPRRETCPGPYPARRQTPSAPLFWD